MKKKDVLKRKNKLGNRGSAMVKEPFIAKTNRRIMS
jgi:hypothetical protein